MSSTRLKKYYYGNEISELEYNSLYDNEKAHFQRKWGPTNAFGTYPISSEDAYPAAGLFDTIPVDNDSSNDSWSADNDTSTDFGGFDGGDFGGGGAGGDW